MASLVCSMSEMTPSVMMRRTWYCEPSVTWAAALWGRGMGSLQQPHWCGAAGPAVGLVAFGDGKGDRLPRRSPSHLVDDGGEVGGTVELDSAQALEVGLQHALDAGAAGIVHIVVLGDRDGRLEGDYGSWYVSPGCRMPGQDAAKAVACPPPQCSPPPSGAPGGTGGRSCRRVGVWHRSRRRGRACHCRSPG